MKSFIPSLLAHTAMAVARNFMAITSPRIIAIVVAIHDFVPSPVIRGRKTRPVPIPVERHHNE